MGYAMWLGPSSVPSQQLAISHEHYYSYRLVEKHRYSVCMCVCVHVCVHVCAHVCMFTCSVCVRLHVVYARVCVYMYCMVV